MALAVADDAKRIAQDGNGDGDSVDGDGDGNGSKSGAQRPDAMATKRVICVLGDGALQMTASELSSFVRYSVPVLFIVSNNKSYAIEEKIHDGEYNNLQVWNYAKVLPFSPFAPRSSA